VYLITFINTGPKLQEHYQIVMKYISWLLKYILNPLAI